MKVFKFGLGQFLQLKNCNQCYHFKSTVLLAQPFWGFEKQGCARDHAKHPWGAMNVEKARPCLALIRDANSMFEDPKWMERLKGSA